MGDWEVSDGLYESTRLQCKYKSDRKCKHPLNSGRLEDIVSHISCIKSKCPLADNNRQMLIEHKCDKIRLLKKEIKALQNKEDN